MHFPVTCCLFLDLHGLFLFSQDKTFLLYICFSGFCRPLVANIFLAGEPGCGKRSLINQLIVGVALTNSYQLRIILFFTWILKIKCLLLFQNGTFPVNTWMHLASFVSFGMYYVNLVIRQIHAIVLLFVTNRSCLFFMCSTLRRYNLMTLQSMYDWYVTALLKITNLLRISRQLAIKIEIYKWVMAKFMTSRWSGICLLTVQCENIGQLCEILRFCAKMCSA